MSNNQSYIAPVQGASEKVSSGLQCLTTLLLTFERWLELAYASSLHASGKAQTLMKRLRNSKAKFPPVYASTDTPQGWYLASSATSFRSTLQLSLLDVRGWYSWPGLWLADNRQGQDCDSFVFNLELLWPQKMFSETSIRRSKNNDWSLRFLSEKSPLNQTAWHRQPAQGSLMFRTGFTSAPLTRRNWLWQSWTGKVCLFFSLVRKIPGRPPWDMEIRACNRYELVYG